MSNYWRFAFLLGKYLLITIVIDPGYSRSRDRTDPGRYWATGYHLCVQLTVSALFLSAHRLTEVIGVCVFEFCLLLLGTLLERHARIIYALRAWAMTELMMVYSYMLVTYLTG